MSALSNRPELLARLGLRLPALALKRLQSAGIFCQPAVSIMYQQRTQSYCLRAVESGGAITELGGYCGFVDEDGNALIWSERVDTLAVNGLHAVMMAPVLVRLEMVRNRLTYELLITRHSLISVPQNQRPQLQSSLLFHGRVSAMAVNNDAESPGKPWAIFGNRSGDAFEIPPRFRAAVQQLVSAVWCVGCRHFHLSRAPEKNVSGNSIRGV